MDATTLNQIESKARERVEASLPGVELLACEDVGSERLRLVIDREGGVDLDLCEQVTELFDDLLEDFALEVSSPGPERPLRTTEHFSRALGSRVRVRTSEPVSGSRNLIGELVAANEVSITVASEQGPEVEVSLDQIARANLAPSAGQGDSSSDNSEDIQSEVTA